MAFQMALMLVTLPHLSSSTLSSHQPFNPPFIFLFIFNIIFYSFPSLDDLLLLTGPLLASYLTSVDTHTHIKSLKPTSTYKRKDAMFLLLCLDPLSQDDYSSSIHLPENFII